jgi:hypothetical protein
MLTSTSTKPGTKAVIYLTVGLGILIILQSLDYFFLSLAINGGTLAPARVAAAKDVFDTVVINALLSMFKIPVTSAALGWVFGKPLVASIAQRMAR